MLRWLRSWIPQCLWTVLDVTHFACEYGRIDVLQFLRSLDPPYRLACEEDTAATHGHLSTLQWLQSQQPPCPWDATEVVITARYYRHQHIVD